MAVGQELIAREASLRKNDGAIGRLKGKGSRFLRRSVSQHSVRIALTVKGNAEDKLSGVSGARAEIVGWDHNRGGGRIKGARDAWVRSHENQVSSGIGNNEKQKRARDLGRE